MSVHLIKKRLRGISWGPWIAEEREEGRFRVRAGERTVVPFVFWERDAQFIAAAQWGVPYLLRLVAILKAENARLCHELGRSAHEHYSHVCSVPGLAFETRPGSDLPVADSFLGQYSIVRRGREFSWRLHWGEHDGTDSTHRSFASIDDAEEDACGHFQMNAADLLMAAGEPDMAVVLDNEFLDIVKEEKGAR